MPASWSTDRIVDRTSMPRGHLALIPVILAEHDSGTNDRHQHDKRPGDYKVVFHQLALGRATQHLDDSATTVPI